MMTCMIFLLRGSEENCDVRLQAVGRNQWEALQQPGTLACCFFTPVEKEDLYFLLNSLLFCMQ